ncbi:hypothetical protein [Aldersonia kunmingensis]|uniref:hypothetical protein n=1 Tax=Aldersonia kunmingensis TaxID=408066 RepID=UPI000AA419F4|nr:hypothetical protein [Aldersonia kunmingensis]
MSLPTTPIRQPLLRAATVLFVLLAGLFGMTAPAQAAPTRVTELGQVHTLAGGSLFCAGSVRVWATTNTDWGDRSILNAQALPMQGLATGSVGTSAGSSLGGPCVVGVRVGWRNVTTGQVGEWRFAVTSGPYGSMQYALFQPTGKGRIVTDVTTDQLNIPSFSAYDVF